MLRASQTRWAFAANETFVLSLLFLLCLLKFNWETKLVFSCSRLSYPSPIVVAERGTEESSRGAGYVGEPDF